MPAPDDTYSRNRAATANSFGNDIAEFAFIDVIPEGATSMALGSGTRGKLDDAQVQIEQLREQVEALMKDRVTPALADFAGRAESAVNTATGAVRQQADAVSGRVKQQPLIALLIAAGLGWLIGRMMR